MGVTPIPISELELRENTWSFNPAYDGFEGPTGYFIAADRIDTKDKLLHLLGHLSNKNWMNRREFHDLIVAVCNHHDLNIYKTDTV